MTIITPQAARGLALARTAETMLRTLGGVEVRVRFASPTTASSAEFGLAGSSITDTPIEPVIVRSSDSRATASSTSAIGTGSPTGSDSGTNNSPQGLPHASPQGRMGNGPEFLFPASPVQKATLAAGYSSPIDWFARSLGIFFNDTLHPIAAVATENFAGQPYLYRITPQ